MIMKCKRGYKLNQVFDSFHIYIIYLLCEKMSIGDGKVKHSNTSWLRHCMLGHLLSLTCGDKT